ncbi:MAG: hypothetical protein ACYC2T_10385 [Bacillota bacterium]
MCHIISNTTIRRLGQPANRKNHQHCGLPRFGCRFLCHRVDLLFRRRVAGPMNNGNIFTGRILMV